MYCHKNYAIFDYYKFRIIYQLKLETFWLNNNISQIHLLGKEH